MSSLIYTHTHTHDNSSNNDDSSSSDDGSSGGSSRNMWLQDCRQTPEALLHPNAPMLDRKQASKHSRTTAQC